MSETIVKGYCTGSHEGSFECQMKSQSLYDACQGQMGGDSAAPDLVKTCTDMYLEAPFDQNSIITQNAGFTAEDHAMLASSVSAAPQGPPAPGGAENALVDENGNGAAATPPAFSAGAGEAGAAGSAATLSTTVVPFTSAKCNNDRECESAYQKLEVACAAEQDPSACISPYTTQPHPHLDQFEQNAGITPVEHDAFEKMKSRHFSGSKFELRISAELGMSFLTFHMTDRAGVPTGSGNVGSEIAMDPAEEQSTNIFAGGLKVAGRFKLGDNRNVRVGPVLGVGWMSLGDYSYGNGIYEDIKPALTIDAGADFAVYVHEHFGIGAEFMYRYLHAKEANLGSTMGELIAHGIVAGLVLDFPINKYFSLFLKGRVQAFECKENGWGGVSNKCYMTSRSGVEATVGGEVMAGAAVTLPFPWE